MSSLNNSDRKDVKFLDRPQTLTVGVFIALGFVAAILALIYFALEPILNFVKFVINE